MANPMLLWFVGYSNITSIAIVTLCFLAMTIFIGFISMNGDSQGRSNVHIGIEQTDMVKMSNPFFLELEQASKKLTDGLHLRLSSLLPSKIFVLWGAKINPFHDLILQPGRSLRRTFVCNNLEDYKDLDVLHCDKMQFFEAGDHSIKLQCPEFVSSETLGDMPRKRYPVAVFIFIPENSSTIVGQETGGVINGDNLSDTETVCERENRNYIIGLISIVHLQDEKVSQSSHIIGQYIKTSGVPLYSLQPLYLNADLTQSQQNHQNRRVNVQHQSQHQNNSTGNSPVNSEASERVNEQNQFHSEDSHAVGEFSGCRNTDQACGGTLSTEGESLMRKCDAQTTTARHRLGNVCDQCYKKCPTASDGKCDNKNNEEHRRTVSERQMPLKSSHDNIDKDSKDEAEFPTSSIAECVVCQTHRVRCALLPCRHACVCLGCFRLLFRCPMCRAGIESYFLLRNHIGDDDDDGSADEDDGSENEMLQDIQQQAVNASVYQTLQRWNDRLNQFLGFR